LNEEGYVAGKSGAPERIRTSDPQIRSLVLYPAELRALACVFHGHAETKAFGELRHTEARHY
jgi:hypothetical protein